MLTSISFDLELSISYVSLKSDNITYVEMSYVLSLFSQALAGCFSDEWNLKKGAGWT